MRVFPLETWGLFGQQWTAGEWTIAIKHKGSKKEGPNWYFVDSCFFMFFSGFKKEWEFNRTFEQVWPYLKRIVWVRKWLQDELSLVVWVFFFLSICRLGDSSLSKLLIFWVHAGFVHSSQVHACFASHAVLERYKSQNLQRVCNFEANKAQIKNGIRFWCSFYFILLKNKKIKTQPIGCA